MGIGRGIAWSLGLVPESDEKLSKKMYKKQKEQYEQYKLREKNIINGIRLYGYKTILEEYKSLPEKLGPMTEEQIKKIWSLEPNIKDDETNKTYSEYFLCENNQDSAKLKEDLLDKEKEILELKLKIKNLERKR